MFHPAVPTRVGARVQNRPAVGAFPLVPAHAERKAGELLAGMVQHEGGRPKQSQGATVLDTLGINKSQSYRWQEEIAEAVGTTQQGVAKVLQRIPSFEFVVELGVHSEIGGVLGGGTVGF